MQKITNAIIYKNARILLGEDCNINYSPQSVYQVIIGQNGIGKSSFLNNLIGYPIVGNKVFHKDGYSTITYDKDGTIITTQQRHDGKYSFIMDDLELNHGGTRTVQCELFAEHLQITPVILQLLEPDFDFLSLRPNQRQDLLSKLTKGDLSFALNLHKRLEQRARQHDNTVKRLEINLADLQSKALSEDDYNNHCKQLKRLQANITHLYMDTQSNISKPRNSDITSINDRISNLKDSLRKEFVKYYPWGGCPGGGIEEAKVIIQDTQVSLRSAQNRLDGLIEQFQVFNTVKESLASGSVEDIDYKLKVLQEELDKLPSEEELWPIYYDSPSDYRNAIKTLERAIDTANAQINAITGDWTQELLSCDLEDLKTRINNVSGQIHRLDGELAQIDETLGHVHTGEIRCPDCGLIFNPELDAMKKERLESRRNAIIESRTKGTVILNNMNLQYEQSQHMRNQYNAILQTMSADVLRPTMEYVNYSTSLLNDPIKWLNNLRSAIFTLRVRCHQAEITEDYDIIVQQRDMLASKNLESTQALIDKTDSLEKSIWECQQHITQLNTRLDYLNERVRLVKRYNDWVKHVRETYSVLQEDLLTLAKWEVNVLQHDILTELQTSIAMLTTAINNYDQQRSQLRYLEEMLENERNMGIAARIAADELSPKTGMIAEQLSGFINAFLKDVMDICNNICTYNVSIYSAKDSAKSLTYQFPVEFNNSGLESEDISKTSAGQYSMINFAIRITALRYAGYQNGPLYLDEPDGDIHPIHKVKMMQFIKLLIEDSVFSQVFMISHHESGWGALPNLDLVDFSNEHHYPSTNRNITFV